MLKLSNEALGAVMMALQKSLLEQSDIVPVLKGFDFKLNSNSLMSLLGIGSGATFGGIPGAVMVPILGTAAKFGARKLTKDAGTKAKAMVAQGATLPPRQRVPIGVNPVAAPILLGRTRD